MTLQLALETNSWTVINHLGASLGFCATTFLRLLGGKHSYGATQYNVFEVLFVCVCASSLAVWVVQLLAFIVSLLILCSPPWNLL